MKNAEQLETRRQQIFESAMMCFIQKGFHQTSMRDIASLAQVSLGNLYNHFRSKEALIAEIATAEMQDLQPLIIALEAEPALPSLLNFAHSYLQLCRHDYYVKLSCEIIAECARNPAIAALFAANREQVCAHLSTCLNAGMRAQEIANDVPADHLAHTLLDLIEGWAFRHNLWQHTKFKHSAASQKSDEKSLFHVIEKLLLPHP